MSDALAELRALDVRTVAAALGLTEGRGGWGPCPVCGASQRSESRNDRRAPIGVVREGRGWNCTRATCDGRGDALGLVAAVVLGSPKWTGNDATRRVIEHARDVGLVPHDDGNYRRREGARTVAVEAPKRPPAPPARVPAPPAEVEALWAACVPVTADAEVAGWLESRGLPPAAVEALDLARALPTDVELPRWASVGRAPWHRGWRCLLPCYASDGALVGLKARLVRKGAPKSTCGTDVTTRGAVLANPAAAALLAGEGAAERVLVVEGEPDLLTAALLAAELAPDVAVFGVWQGAWTDHGNALGAHHRVLLATDNNPAGDKFADAICRTLPCPSRRWRCEPGTDWNDRPDLLERVMRDENVWDFSPEEEPPAPVPESRPFLAPLSDYTEADLAADAERHLLEIAELPAWPEQGGGWKPDNRTNHDLDAGHGLGRVLAGILGGGLEIGNVGLIGARRAGAGKTTLLLQLVEGLALRSAKLTTTDNKTDGALTPVVLMTELPRRLVIRRSLSRWLGLPGSYLRSRSGTARVARGVLPELLQRAASSEHAAELVWGELAPAARRELTPAHRFVRVLSTSECRLRGPDALGAIEDEVRQWVVELEAEHGREVVPILALDPLQRWADPTKPEIEGHAELCGAFTRVVRSNGWVGLATSDTNKATATGQNPKNRTDNEVATGAFRGTYALMHEASFALYLDRVEDPEPVNGAGLAQGVYVRVGVVKNWEGPDLPSPSAWAGLAWDVTCSRLYPLTVEGTELLRPKPKPKPKPPNQPSVAPFKPPSASEILGGSPK